MLLDMSGLRSFVSWILGTWEPVVCVGVKSPSLSFSFPEQALLGFGSLSPSLKRVITLPKHSPNQGEPLKRRKESFPGAVPRLSARWEDIFFDGVFLQSSSR